MYRCSQGHVGQAVKHWVRRAVPLNFYNFLKKPMILKNILIVAGRLVGNNTGFGQV